MDDKTVLIVDDEQPIRQMIDYALKREGFLTLEAANASQARLALADARPDVILLDWMLPETSGLDLARELRRSDASAQIPIIMLTARTEEEDKVRGLEGGADDYVTKPFAPRELVARIRAVLRRSGKGEEEILEAGDLRLDGGAYRVTAGEAPVDLGPTEFRMLRFFMSHPDRVYTRGQLLDRVWGANVYVEERTVDVHIRRLRKALEPSATDRYVQTVRGAGYRFSIQT